VRNEVAKHLEKAQDLQSKMTARKILARTASGARDSEPHATRIAYRSGVTMIATNADFGAR
jgi:hypothetical protein